MNSDRIQSMSEEFRDYLHDETKTVGTAESISFPASEADMTQILAEMSGKKIQVTVQGNRTGLTAGCVPGGGHIMSMSHMDKVMGLRIDENGTVLLRVQPGLSLGVLRKMIAARSFETGGWDEASLRDYERFRKLPPQYFPPDPTESSASLGGMVACNSSGAKTYLYGPTRPYVEALRVVLADGDVIALRRGEHFAKGRQFSLKTLGGSLISGQLPTYRMPTCKNASGYYVQDDMDLLDLFVGSDGTLGALSELELRLIPMPGVIWGINCFFKTEAQALDFVELARQTAAPLAAMEYFDGNALDILRGYDDGGCPVPAGFGCMIYVEIHTNDEAAALEEIKILGQVMEQAGGDSANTWAARSLPDRERLLELRHKVPESVNALIAQRKRAIPSIAKVGSDMAVPDGKFREVMAMYHADLAKNGFSFAIWGHIGNNHLHVNVLPRTQEDMVKGKAMFADWARTITQMGGTVSAEHGAGKTKANLLEIMYGRQGILEMAAVKKAFDPDCILNVGNLFPGEYV